MHSQARSRTTSALFSIPETHKGLIRSTIPMPSLNVSGGTSSGSKPVAYGCKGGSLQFVIVDLEDVGAIDYHAKSRMARTSKVDTTEQIARRVC